MTSITSVTSITNHTGTISQIIHYQSQQKNHKYHCADADSADEQAAESQPQGTAEDEQQPWYDWAAGRPPHLEEYCTDDGFSD